MVNRIYVEKKPGCDVEAQALCADLRENLKITGVESVRVLVRYDVEGLGTQELERAKGIVFSEPPVDICTGEAPVLGAKDRAFTVQYLPGQYDNRADFASQCLQLVTSGERPRVAAAKLIILSGGISDGDFVRVKEYCINPVEAHEVSDAVPQSLEPGGDAPPDVETAAGFTALDKDGLGALISSLGLAMDLDDIRFCQGYFKEQEQRDPTMTELRMIDTYWSDHCRHTTFLTRLDSIDLQEPAAKEAFLAYQKDREAVYGEKPKAVTLMDMATLFMKKQKREGKLPDLDASEEINACSIRARVEVGGKSEPWLIMFKNETHNHPTEIEPFGGAATCLGGAIRDPLSGRSYVYQAMRVTGSADPTAPIESTLPGKLPQRKITTTAAAGYSSYGNQIGLATGLVDEVYHPGYLAKRMEIGAVIGAAPEANVVRERPAAGDAVILLGGRTGRDGCGGATGSSKEHTEESITVCSAQVQKGNPPEERKLQRLFRNPAATRLIKRCNDFGAGGVSVAIGELADGLQIDLDAVLKKYEGLDGTELAISESQERMAVVVRPEDAQAFISLAREENLEATPVAVVTDENRLVMRWRGQVICDINRDFLNTNGAEKRADALVEPVDYAKSPLTQKKSGAVEDLWHETLSGLNVCSKKGLIEWFDASIGAGSVLMPLGGARQLTPQQAMVAKVPVLGGETDTATVMSYGFDPDIAQWSPFHGAVYAVVESVAKIVAAGGNSRSIHLTFQEYFERLRNEPSRWGKPVAALLGAYHAQKSLGIAAIGGKDSVSGSFLDLDVPPALVSFAVDVMPASLAVSGEFKRPGSRVYLIEVKRDEKQLPDFEDLLQKYDAVHQLMKEKKVLAAYAVRRGGLCEAVSKMSFGNGIGFTFEKDVTPGELFAPSYGALVLEGAEALPVGRLIGVTGGMGITAGDTSLSLDALADAWTKPLEAVFPTTAKGQGNESASPSLYTKGPIIAAQGKLARPRVVIPVFPGTNCEYDTQRAFEKAGAAVELVVVRNQTQAEIEETIEALAQKIAQSNILTLPGGFSAGDEPDGSGKFIAAFFKNPRLKEEVHRLLQQRDGLVLGICNGFQALVKLGLLPWGEIRDMEDGSPTLTYNTIGRHVSCMVRTVTVSSLSPWLSGSRPGQIHTIPVSHGEGRFVASEQALRRLSQSGQIATQYVDPQGNPTMEQPYNPNGSLWAIEGITSADGRIFGKMGHSERIGSNIAKNIPGLQDQKIFESGVGYFL